MAITSCFLVISFVAAENFRYSAVSAQKCLITQNQYQVKQQKAGAP